MCGYIKTENALDKQRDNKCIIQAHERYAMILYATSIFLSAFLVFQVQPIIARYILPWFGGTPAVWSTVMLFFQVLLTGGYAYAYWLMSRTRQARLHLTLLSLSSAILLILLIFWPSPITPGPEWKPVGIDFPVLRIFLLLAISVGLPYFMLATNSPLQQAWFGRANPGKSPYWLYALSNIGSLLALLSYPFMIEPWLTLQQQGLLWSLGYVCFAVLAGCGAWRSMRVEAVQAARHITGPGPTTFQQILWIALSATASVMLLAVTSKITQEIAAGPFLWVLPLAIYLLSFVLAFSGEGLYSRPVFSFLFSLASALVLFLAPGAAIILQVDVYLFFLFVVCMIAHGELYRLRPDPGHLTRFYLMVSIGGALGGLFVNLVAPKIFTGYLELSLGWAALAVLMVILAFYRPTALASCWRFLHDGWVGILAVVLVIFFVYGVAVPHKGALFRERDFYGVVRVDADEQTYKLVHGSTSHGVQFRDPKRRSIPTGYYWSKGGFGLLMRNHPKYGRHPMRVGVLGLGVGVMAAYGNEADTYRFYEISPIVTKLAQGHGGFFSFLNDTPARVEVVQGDARISLENEASQAYDLLALDVFSSDAIPVHLLTLEAFEIYLRHLAPDGMLIVHITNNHLDLRPVIWNIGQALGLRVVSLNVLKIPKNRSMAHPSRLMALSRNPALFDFPEIAAAADTMESFSTDMRLWTDDYSNLFQVLK